MEANYDFYSTLFLQLIQLIVEFHMLPSTLPPLIQTSSVFSQGELMELVHEINDLLEIVTTRGTTELSADSSLSLETLQRAHAIWQRSKTLKGPIFVSIWDEGPTKYVTRLLSHLKVGKSLFFSFEMNLFFFGSDWNRILNLQLSPRMNFLL